MRHQLHFYLNDDKITDDFIIQEIKKESNLSNLIKSLLYVYYKELKPYGERKTEDLAQILKATLTKER